MSLKLQEKEIQNLNTDELIKRVSELFESEWSRLVDYLTDGCLVHLFSECNIPINGTSIRRRGEHEGRHFEFDIIAHNGKEIVIVEVKTTLRVKDVSHLISKLEKARIWMEDYKDTTIYGAVAFLKDESGAAALAEKKKLFVVKATGNSAAIVNAETFRPKVF